MKMKGKKHYERKIFRNNVMALAKKYDRLFRENRKTDNQGQHKKKKR